MSCCWRCNKIYREARLCLLVLPSRSAVKDVSATESATGWFPISFHHVQQNIALTDKILGPLNGLCFQIIFRKPKPF